MPGPAGDSRLSFAPSPQGDERNGVHPPSLVVLLLSLRNQAVFLEATSPTRATHRESDPESPSLPVSNAPFERFFPQPTVLRLQGSPLFRSHKLSNPNGINPRTPEKLPRTGRRHWRASFAAGSGIWAPEGAHLRREYRHNCAREVATFRRF